MEISDLFDTHRRDAAVRELPDEDLLVAATIVTQKRPTDANLRDWLALDVAWFALHTKHDETAAAIMRQGATVLSVFSLFTAFARVTHFREYEEHHDRLRRTDKLSRQVVHVLAQRHSTAIATELCRVEVERFCTEGMSAHSGLVSDLMQRLDDPELFTPLLKSEKFADLSFIKRLWELGAEAAVIEAAFDIDSGAAMWWHRKAQQFLKERGIKHDPAARTTS